MVIDNDYHQRSPTPKVGVQGVSRDRTHLICTRLTTRRSHNVQLHSNLNDLTTRRSYEVKSHSKLNDLGRGAKFDDDKAAAHQCLISGSRLRSTMICSKAVLFGVATYFTGVGPNAICAQSRVPAYGLPQYAMRDVQDTRRTL